MKEQEKREQNSDPEFERIDKYREDLENDIIESEKNYNTIITYLAAGALGLFLTINEKFFRLTESRCFWLFVVSLSLLFLTLLLYLINVVYDVVIQKKLRDKTTERIKKGQFNTNDLDIYWEKKNSFSQGMMYFRLVTVILGIAAEIIFIVSNMNSKKVEEKTPVIKVEISSFKDSTKILVDSSEKHNAKIEIVDK